MNRRDTLLCAGYVAVAVAALVGTQTALVRHVADGRSATEALTDTVATPAAAFVTIDLLAVAAAALVFMVVESRRLRLPRLWLYLLLTFTVAISVAFPLFLVERQRRVNSITVVAGS